MKKYFNPFYEESETQLINVPKTADNEHTGNLFSNVTQEDEIRAQLYGPIDHEQEYRESYATDQSSDNAQSFYLDNRLESCPEDADEDIEDEK